MAKFGRNDPCFCGSGVKYKKCCLDRGSDRAGSDSAPGLDSELTITLETPKGFMVRRIPPAMPPRLGAGLSKGVEAATYEAAAIWGLPDLTFKPGLRRLGSGHREIGDGVILSATHGLMVQVKCREAATADPQREARWLEKNIAKALRQARGSIRQLRMAPAVMENGRGREVEVRAEDRRWISVIVIDHPDPPGDQIPAAEEDLSDAVVLLRRDWEFLYDQLRSSSAVAGYLERVSGEQAMLGVEPARYYERAAADAEAAPAILDPHFLVGNVPVVSEPLLPFQPVEDEGTGSQALYRSLLEDIAMTRLQEASETQRLEALAELDRLPVKHRDLISSFLRDKFRVVSGQRDGVEWHFRRVAGGSGGTQLAYAVCSSFDEDIEAAFQAWAQLRHHEFQQRLDGGREIKTVAVLITPRRDGQRDWDTTMCFIAGGLGLDSEAVREYQDVWLPEVEAVAA